MALQHWYSVSNLLFVWYKSSLQQTKKKKKKKKSPFYIVGKWQNGSPCVIDFYSSVREKLNFSAPKLCVSCEIRKQKNIYTYMALNGDRLAV